MTDTVFIEALTFDAIIGIRAHERVNPQPVVMDISMSCDCTEAAESADINEAVSYSDVARSLEEFVIEQQFELLETLAVRCAERVLEEQPLVSNVTVKVAKPDAIRNASAVGVVVHRAR